MNYFKNLNIDLKPRVLDTAVSINNKINLKFIINNILNTDEYNTYNDYLNILDEDELNTDEYEFYNLIINYIENYFIINNLKNKNNYNYLKFYIINFINKKYNL
jgi:hypothetical protein